MRIVGSLFCSRFNVPMMRRVLFIRHQNVNNVPHTGLFPRVSSPLCTVDIPDIPGITVVYPRVGITVVYLGCITVVYLGV